MNLAAAITYHAPEKILGWEWDRSVDWWSFGLVVYWTFTGQVRWRVLADTISG